MPSDATIAPDQMDNPARARHAERLVTSGSAEEGRREFEALRPELLRDPGAPAYLTEALCACGLGTVAEEWLTEAVTTIAGGVSDAGRAEQLFELVRERHRVREELDLGHDDLDDLYHEMEAAAGGPDPQEGRAMLFWPAPEFTRLIARWPERADIYNPDWDRHREGVERALSAWSDAGVVHLGLIVGSVDALEAFAAAEGLDPAAQDTHAAYADEAADAQGAAEWPPQRNAACWCGSGTKYKKCCLPRARG
ncbi:preprotein translocase SecA [Actinoplanes ianthinogenes]|uniref:Preprotein translocase SecA n=1 Tax=Actinoplanes ianthinogenes TaxID=122358 RepID=A0ABM7LZL0_9ACTN|nr:SEC-C metal-binding domain-containing protein [Actinoplanes ianthinogenes]BCJ44726.1 preprotein translocase SecA [Actinoplanes ianthinogenes]GGQ99600.1 preprotein translocase SecA [Actinoplanes ianthinogenes]